MRKVVCDIETDGLLLEATKIHCIVCEDIDTGEIFEFTDSPLTCLNFDDFKEFASNVTLWIGHNWLGFDLFILNDLFDMRIKPAQVEDTLVMSRLFCSGFFGQHSIEAWAKRLKIGIDKVENEDWSRLTPNMLERCVSDVKLNTALYRQLQRYGKGFSEASIRIEHNMQYLLTKQKIRGVYIDVPRAEEMYLECTRLSDDIRRKAQEAFPPVRKDIRTFRPRVVHDKKTGKPRIHGQDKRTLANNMYERNGDGTVTLFEMQEFNLDSSTQCVEKLNEAGWKPYEFNKVTAKQEADGQTVGTPKISEANLATLPDDAPEGARLISEYKMLVNRARTARQWLDSVDDNNRLHGDVRSVGAWTQRCAHSNPQTANIASVKHDDDGNILKGQEGRYGWDSRACWTVSDTSKRCIVGVDAKGIQLRVLAHYMNDPLYIKTVTEGDPHAFNRDSLGLPDTKEGRDSAKRWIYAWLLGGGSFKLGQILGTNAADAKEREAMFLERIPALADLKSRQLHDVRRGWFRGLDGRRVPAKSDHLVMSAYLQAGESVIMKKAYIDAAVGMMKEGLDAEIVLFVHDEFQADSLLTCADRCGTILVEAINNTTDYFSLNCPMEGDEPKIGTSWADTH